MYIIDENRAQEIMTENGGRFTTVRFIKKNGEPRTMNGRIGVKKYIKGTGRKQNPPNIVTLWDRRIKQYRSFDIRRVVSIAANGKRYTVAHSTDV